MIKIRRTVIGALMVGAIGMSAKPMIAQRTGTLAPKVKIGNQAPIEGRVASTEDEIERIYGRYLDVTEQRRLALVATSLTGSEAIRASNWSLNISGLTGKSEARLQLNLCDALPEACEKTESGFDLGFAGPLSKSGNFTELADLNGLFGTTRIEGGGTWHPVKSNAVTGSARASWWPASTFDYRSAGTLTKTSERHGVTSIDGELGYRWTSLFVGVGGRYEDSYKDADEKLVCDAPAQLGSAFSCVQSPIGAPVRSLKSVVAPEVRWALSQMVAASLTYSFDSRSKAGAWDLPIWASYTGKEGMGGGVRFGYRVGDKHATATLFVGAFKL